MCVTHGDGGRIPAPLLQETKSVEHCKFSVSGGK